MELEHYRKDVKRLLRAFRVGEPEALQRANESLGDRAHERFLLGDAQHVVAIEHGYRLVAPAQARARACPIRSPGRADRPAACVVL